MFELSSSTLALLLTVMLVIAVSNASAKEHKPRGYDAESHVVAHVAFGGLSVVDMAMPRKVNDKYYLYVEHSRDQGISIVDISKPTRPRAVAVIPWPARDLSGRMSMTGNLAIIAETGDLQTDGTTSNHDLVLWDLSNPIAPRVVQKFSGVVKWLQDERNFIYVLNGEGLWVISMPKDLQPEPTWPSLLREDQ
jgi:hypothetical protein